MSDLILPDESYAIMGACFDVYNEKGCGFLEPIYHECLAIEFAMRRVPFVHEPRLNLRYKGQLLAHTYSPDFFCWEKIVVELKACERLCDEHVAQVLNYLNASGAQLELLVNFGHYPKLEYRRIAHTQTHSRSGA